MRSSGGGGGGDCCWASAGGGGGGDCFSACELLLRPDAETPSTFMAVPLKLPNLLSGGWYASRVRVAKYWSEGCVYPVTFAFCSFQFVVGTVPTGAVSLT